MFQSNILGYRYRTMFFGIGRFYMLTCLKENVDIDISLLNDRIYANMLLSKIENGYAVFLYYNVNIFKGDMR